MMFKKGRPKMLFRRENTTARGAIRHGGEYRWQRHKKHAIDENLPMREGMHGRMQQGIDYTPLFKFLLRNVGQPWIDVHREAISRLDKEEPIFYLVALQRKNWSSYVRYGESSYYSGLCIDEQGLLQKVNPEFTAEDVPVRCRCCTYTFNGERVPVTEKNWLKPYEKENWE
ncbi:MULTISPECIES: hypothetical protein [Serratia]|jgi:hypothetical protein|uniref:hypothetical protein n=2 Tax=Serratia TaxID=613 RepID=UPI000D512F33|nr:MULTISPECIES: hypothetical protein [Serratia]NWA19204.1 hypothetical protein [Serratia liquefaciens]PVD44220.1 hypothetical protein C5188_07110 [Serratia liquefaciens]QHT51148.1 hypothetical protein C5686_012745 [Serratia liquefaciens]RYM65534.1 hypothetical protein BSQ98_07165 [Serratia liquefaciens]HBL6729078.1 hypothetical protein [Serratia liquefaciens]